MKACVKVFTAKATGTGTQTVTGIVDENSVNFTPLAIIFFSLSTSTAVNTTGTFFGFSHGFTITDGSPQYGECGDEQSPGFKECGAASSGNGYAILGYTTAAAFAGTIHREAYVSSVAAGQFTLTYDLNDFTTDSIIAVCLGGTDLLAKVGQASSSTGSITVGFQPEATIFKGQTLFNSTNKAVGAVQPQFGWGTRTSGQGAASGLAIAQSSNYRYQRVDKCVVQLNGTTGVVLAEGTITNWFATGFTLSQNFNTTAYLSVGGIQAAAGSFTQASTTGAQKITTGISNKVVILLSFGSPSNNSPKSDQAEFVIGAIDIIANQASLWGGENTVGNTTLHGARFLSSNSVLRFATPTGSTTSYSAVATGSIGTTDNSFTATWTTADTIGREILWLALGDPGVNPPPPTPSSGIYQLVPNKTDDTIYVSTSTGTTTRVAIP